MRPRYRIKWNYNDESGQVIGYWVFTRNIEAHRLLPSQYYRI